MAKKSIATRKSEIATLLADNTNEDISAADVRQPLVDSADSTFSLDDHDTDNISEGTKKFYSESLFDASLQGKDTGDVAEGSNLYFTQARARGSFSAGTNISIDANGVISATGSNAYASPSVHNFSITGATPADGNLSGPVVVHYSVSNPQNVSGNLQLQWSRDGTNWNDITGTTIPANGMQASVTLPSITIAQGADVHFRLEATDTNSLEHYSNYFTVTRTQAHERIYWGASATRPTTGYDTTSAQGSADVDPNGGSVDIAMDTPDTQFIYFAVPANVTVDTLTQFGSNVLRAFTETDGAFTIGTTAYKLYTQQNNGGARATFRYTLNYSVS